MDFSVGNNPVAEGKETWRAGQGFDARRAGRGQFVELASLPLITNIKIKKSSILAVCILLPLLELAIFHYQ